MLNQIYQLMQGHASACFLMVILIASICIDVSKLRLDPWKSAGKLLKKLIAKTGNLLNGDLCEKVDQTVESLACVHERLNNIEFESREERKQTKRRTVLRFADECRVGVVHSKEMFDNILADIDEYETLCRDTKDPNSVMDEAVKYIKETNHKCFVKNSYL